MTSENGGATIDSLVTFKYKKKFSFTKKANPLASTDDGESEIEENSEDESSADGSDLDELRAKNLNYKGSARLKSPGAARDNSSDEGDQSKSLKKSKKHKK